MPAIGVDSADRVLHILCQADGGCSSCVNALIRAFLEEWPQHEELAKSVYLKEFPYRRWHLRRRECEEQ